VLGESLFFTCESKERKKLGALASLREKFKKLDEIAL
jgi:hypothetical protein